MRRAGDGESTSIPFLIRVAGAEEGKIDELSRLEFEAFGLRKIERRSAGTESLMSLQAYFVWGHMLLLPLWLVWPTRSNRPRIGRGLRGSYDWMTGAGGFLFHRERRVFIGMIRGATAFQRRRRDQQKSVPH
jgi:hypothetical protein